MEERAIKELIMYFDRAADFRENGEFKYAIEVLNKALEVDEHNTDALNMLGEIYADMNDWENSVKTYKRVLEIDKNNKHAYNQLFKNFYKVGRYGEALKVAQKALAIDSCENNYLKLISVLDKFADIKTLRELVKNNDLTQKSLLKIASVFINHAYLEDAQKLFVRIQDSPEKKAIEALVEFNKNNIAKAKEILSNINLQNDEVLNLKGIFYLEDLNFTEAIRYFKAAINIDKNVPKYFYNLGNAYFYNGWLDEAECAYKHAIELDKSNVDYRFALANLYWETHNLNKAKQEVANILSLDSAHLETRILNAIIKHKNRDFLGAKQDLEDVLKTSPDNNWAKITLIGVLTDLKLWNKADELLSTIKSDSSDLRLTCAKAYLALNKGENETAIILINDILNEKEYYMPALDIAMKASYNLGDMHLVQQFAQQALTADINYSQGYYFLALVREKESDYEEAVECLKRAITYDLENPIYYAKMAEVYDIIGDYKSALNYAGEALSIDEHSAEYKELYADIAHKMRNICQKK